MADMNYEDILKRLEKERVCELACANVSKDLMTKTLNPFRKFSCYQSYKRFMDHVFGIDLAIQCVKREKGA